MDSSNSAERDPAEVVSLHERAADNLSYIRSTLESAGSFTAVPGWGGVAMGLCGVAGAVVAATASGFAAWLSVWLATAGVALLGGGLGMWLKMRSTGTSLLRGPGRKFLLGLSPALVAAVPITWMLVPAEDPAPLVAAWLLLYGAAVVAAGVYSIRLVPVMGATFMLLGAVSLFLPPALAQVCMGIGFGGLHILFGAIIAVRHGG